MLNIASDLHIASGHYRDCYRHPHDDGLCVKVTKPGAEDRFHSEEIAFFERIKHFRDVTGSPALAAYHGTAETNRGLGIVSELVRDHPSGNASRTLFAVIYDRESDLGETTLDTALAAFRADLLEAAIICKDLNPRNICVQRRSGTVRMRLIDGFGNAKTHPLNDRIKPLARLQIRRFMRREELTSVAAIRARTSALYAAAGEPIDY